MLRKQGTSHDVKGFAIGSVLKRIVAERANDDLCEKGVKNAGNHKIGLFYQLIFS